ncbi:MAG: MFS transporter [Nitrospirota bacterium]
MTMHDRNGIVDSLETKGTVPKIGIRGLSRNVVILGFVSLLNDGASEMIYPLLPVFLAVVLGAGPAALGLIEGIAETTASLMKLYSGYLSDRARQRKAWIVAGYSTSNIVRPFIALATSWFGVLVLRFFDRVGKGIRTSPRDAVIADSTAPESRGMAYGFHRAMDHGGAIMGPLLATGLLLLLGGTTQENLTTVFLLSFIPGGLAVAVLLFGLKETSLKNPDTHSRDSLNIRAAWTGMPANFKKYLAILFLFTLGNSTDAFLLLRAQHLGVPVALLPTIWVVLHIVKMGVSIPGGIVSDRIGRKKVIVSGWIVYAFVYMGFAFADAQWQAWALFAVYGIYFGLTEGVEKALVADFIPAHVRGSAFGLYHLVIGVGALPASLLFGLVWQMYGTATAFIMGSGVAFLATVLILMLRISRPTTNHSS